MPRNVQTGALKWLGDSLIDTGRPVRITFECTDGTCKSLSLRDALARAHRIDACGLQRVASALESCASHGELLYDDMAAWRSARASVLTLVAMRNERSPLYGRTLQQELAHA